MLYRTARIDPLIKLGLLNSDDKELLSELRKHCLDLEDHRDYFIKTLESTKVLRDGVRISRI